MPHRRSFALVGGLADVGDGLNLSVAIAVGFIALAGVAAETGVVMLIYLDSAVTDLQTGRSAEGRPFTRDDLRAAIMSQHDGAEPCGAVEPPSRRRADLLAFLKDATQPGHAPSTTKFALRNTLPRASEKS